MAKHRRFTSVDRATSETVGESRKSRGHPQAALFATVVDPADELTSLDVTITGSPADETYALLRRGAPRVDDPFKLTFPEDFRTVSDGGTEYDVAYISNHNTPIEHLRAEILTYETASADPAQPPEVTLEIFISGNSGDGKSFEEREDTPTGQLGRA